MSTKKQKTKSAIQGYTGRAPATPLIVHDPYFSMWSFADKLTDEWPKHWTGTIRGAAGMIRIDGVPYAWMGPVCEKRMEQLSCEILPTRTIYTFQAAGVALTVSFVSPILPDDLEILSRPLSYVTLDVHSVDGRAHHIAVYFDVGAEWATDTMNQQVIWMHHRLEGLSVMRAGTFDQRVLGRVGDNIRCDWGYCYVALPSENTVTAIGDDGILRSSFRKSGTIPVSDDLAQPRSVREGCVKMAAMVDLGSAKTASTYFMIAYDDIVCNEYMGMKLKPYWRKSGMDMGALILTAAKDREKLTARCAAFDRSLLASCERAGGTQYRDLCSLSYRQAVGAHKVALAFDGSPYFFSKENFSNGCIATVDVTYPSAPLFLLVAPKLLEGMMTPIFEYAQSSRWRFPFAPHDLGTFPLANGQIYGGGERTEDNQMPVEECGNMLILAAALLKATDDLSYAKRYWSALSTWAEYLAEKGLDPEHQLCTDDFAGHLAHNANLSIKAILGIASYAQIAARLKDKKNAVKYRTIAKKMASSWIRMADDGDHYRLVFDKPGTWSQKYNLVWDELLGLHIFPASIARKETAFCLRKQNVYGLPLDSRKDYTKIDWILWTATFAENDTDFAAFISPLMRWLKETPTRVPLTDWYDTVNGKQIGFQARSVVGGLFIKTLAKMWKKKQPDSAR
ncbi:MAG: DUF4965 domain-containing protein [Spirochaetes bacterium]|nr:DUF4965 domain-containing protein [Spirochaetota bacterium]